MSLRTIHNMLTDNKNASSLVTWSNTSDTSQTQKHQQHDYCLFNSYEMQEQFIFVISHHSWKRSQLNSTNSAQVSSASVEQDNFILSSSLTSLNLKEKSNIKKNVY